MSTVLITGALGYVGGRVGMHLAECGYTLRLGTRRPQDPAPAWLRNGTLTACDLFNDDQLQTSCNGADAIVHLAAINEHVCAADPELAVRVNGLGSLRILRAAIRAGAKRFVYLSTAHVYGAPLAGIITELTLPQPRHPYAISHRIAEDFVLAAHASREIEGLVLRLSNGYGAPERADVNRWTLLVNDLCKQAVTTRRMVLRSAGNDERDFITLGDAAGAIAHTLTVEYEKLGDGLFNVGSGRSMRVRDVTDMIAARCKQVLGFSPEIVRPEATAPAPKLEYRINKFSATGFSPAGKMVDEIDATLRLCDSAFGTAR